MSSSISMGGAAERPDPAVTKIPKKESAPELPRTKQIQNTEEMKRAEIKGEDISISEEQLIRAIERAIKAIQGPDTRLDFSIHDQTKRIMVKVINEQSGEIIREIPPEKNLDLLAKLWEMAGIMVDERR